MSVYGAVKREYYMAAREYEFYLRELLVSLTSERRERVRNTIRYLLVLAAREDKIRIPKRSCNILFSL